MVHKNFIKLIEQESSEFIALINILTPLNVHAIEGRKLLCLVNHIIDFYILREVKSDKDIKMPIIYFPICEEWAQILCEEFVTLKMSLLWGEGTRTGLVTSYKCRPYVFLPEGVNKREREALSKQFKFKKNVTKFLTESVKVYPCKENEKCFIYSRNISNEFQLTSNTKGHYHFCSDLIDRSFKTEKSMILLEENEDDLYAAIEENDGKVKVPNFFLFLQKDIDGRNTPFCMQMQRSTINEYNEDYNTGIHNVFFFVFSQKPYRLQQVYENKHNLVERLQREKIAKTRDFISFTKAEIDFLFGREEASINKYELDYEKESEQDQIKSMFDLILQDMPHEVKLRNELAICFTENSRTKIKNDILTQNPEANEEYLDYFLKIIQTIYENQLSNTLCEWINFEQIAVVLDYNIDSFYKYQLQTYLQTECGASSVIFYTFKNFNAHKNGSVFLNSINEKKILVLSMLNHCTGRNWAIYPNSFDQYFLNPQQSVLQINNKVIFDPRFSWYQYRYAEQLKLLLNSDFRVKYMKNEIELPARPIHVGPEPKDDEDELNAYNRQYVREQNKVLISFGPGQHRTLYEDELVVCKYCDEMSICTICDIFRDFNDPIGLMIQPLIDFHQALDVFIDNEEHKIGNGESIIRNNPKYCLSDEEKVSKREMWKILLDHLVAKQGEETVYNNIMDVLLPVERIQIASFRRWLDPTENSILPRSRRMQKRVIEEYLQIDSLYTRMLRYRKSRISTNTEGKNTIFRTFLTHCLLETDTQKAYTHLSHEVCDYLNIDSENDIRVLIELIKEETLNLRPIKSIKYDKR